MHVLTESLRQEETVVADRGEKALDWILKNQDDLVKLSDEVWGYSELGLHENRSAKSEEAYLKQKGFAIESGVAGMPTAFVATWGKGKPVIGFLGEFDALPECSTEPTPVRKEIEVQGPGHGCGHNLLGVAALGAAVAMKAELEASGKPGTVKYFGCPAEENFAGKAYMARAGLFDDLDCSLTWHAGALNAVRNSSSLAVNMVQVHFKGRTSHAAATPHHGRSALDAVELMNIGVNYLREHVMDQVRMHYVITNGGRQPNVVPAEATVWYYVRAPRRGDVDETYARVLKCAHGASIMTDTTYEVEFLASMNEVVPNNVLSHVLRANMNRVGPPRFTEADFEFAREIAKTFPEGQREAVLRQENVPADSANDILHTHILPEGTAERRGGGSTDVGDVSWVVPTAQFNTACYAIGTAGHSWQIAAQSGMGIGHAGMIAATKILALSGLELMDKPELLKQAWDEFKERTGGKPYKGGIPDGVNPPLHIYSK
jgi:aminobenzoyl-glutamate utilization protein B